MKGVGNKRTNTIKMDFWENVFEVLGVFRVLGVGSEWYGVWVRGVGGAVGISKKFPGKCSEIPYNFPKNSETFSVREIDIESETTKWYFGERPSGE